MFHWNFIPCSVLVSITISTIQYIESIYLLYDFFFPIICKEQRKNKLTLCLALKLEVKQQLKLSVFMLNKFVKFKPNILYFVINAFGFKTNFK